MNTRALGLLALATLLLSGCKSPFDSTRNASNGGGTGQFSSNGTFVIFSNELTTGGGAFEYPGGDNQSLSFSDTSDPISRRSIRYSWTGGSVAGQVIFAGFDLMYATTQGAYNPSPGVPGRDLHKAGYTKATFYARGSLSTDTDLKIEVADDGNTATPDPCMTLSVSGTDQHCSDNVADPLETTGELTGSWQQYTILIPNSALANVKDFFKATFVFNQPPGSTAPGQGGVAYFDQIQYQP